MRRIYDYRCEGCSHIFEAYKGYEESSHEICPRCAHRAEKILSGGNFKLPGHDPAFPTAGDKWARRHRFANRENLKELGQPV